MDEIVPIKVELPNSSNNIKIYALADTHLGDATVDIKQLETIVNFIKNTPNAYCVLLGDILNTGLKNSKSDIYSETMNVAQAQKLALELLSPIKDKILAMTPGNHENRIWREVGVDVSLWLAERLGIQDRYRVNGFALSIDFGKDTSQNPYTLNIFAQHGGYGGGRKLGSAMSAIEDMDGIVNNADIYMRAHTHSPVQGSRQVFSFNSNGNIVKQNKYYFNAPALMGYGGYGYDKGYRPQDNSPCYLNIRGVCTRQGSRLVKAFKIDKIML